MHWTQEGSCANIGFAGGVPMLDLDRFIADCRDALRTTPSQGAVREVLARALTDASGVMQAIGEPSRSQVTTLYRASDLTILNVCWAPMMTVWPHNHRMWAVIGIYTGREDNIF